MYPANLAGVPDALIFFCLLFFHQGKKRRWGIRGKAPLIDSPLCTSFHTRYVSFQIHIAL